MLIKLDDSCVKKYSKDLMLSPTNCLIKEIYLSSRIQRTILEVRTILPSKMKCAILLCKQLCDALSIAVATPVPGIAP